MSDINFNKTRFIKVSVTPNDLPDNKLPEIVLSGKSNVGKSSLINAVMNRKALARVSAQPGKTQTINFYNINDEIYVVDLPGYGFAKASEKEREKAGTLLDFDDEVFTKDNTLGVHARGCGDVDCDKNYCVPQPPTALASYEDTVQYQIPLVEQMIIDEYGLEFTFEGKRFYDLMRIALRRNDPAYLADAIAKRNGKIDDALRSKLMDKRNWFLPLR